MQKAPVGTHPWLFPKFSGHVAADRAQTDGWIAKGQAELATAGIRLQAFQKPRFPSPSHFTQVGEPRLVANELPGAFEPHHQLFQPAGVLLREFHVHLSNRTNPETVLARYQ
jgi:hypothetical protein